MRLPFESGAADELEATAAWYERERPGYGALFMSEVRKSVDRAARFPYSVVTAIVDGCRAVVAVAHGNREPGYWRDRLK